MVLCAVWTKIHSVSSDKNVVLTRMMLKEIIVLMLATLLAILGVNLFYEALLFLAVITHLTVLQRVLYAKKMI